MNPDESPLLSAAESASTLAVGARRLQPKPAGVAAQLRWTVSVYWHRALVAVRSKRWWLQTSGFFGVWLMIGWPLFDAQAPGRGVAFAALAVVMKFGMARRLAWSAEMRLVPRFYIERKLMMYRLVLESRRASDMGPREIARYQRDALALIANYVRSHREDPDGSTIFVNLVVADGDTVRVVARSDDHRVPFATYPRATSLAGQVIDTGEVGYTGNIAVDWGVSGKPYKSVLVLPVRDESAILGAVAIDSGKAYHFDIEHNDLDRALQPYIALLVWTLEQNPTTLNGLGLDAPTPTEVAHDERGDLSESSRP